MALRRGATPLAIVVALCLIAATRTEAQLRVGFYSRICPKPELIVKQEVEKAVRANPGIAAGLLRLHFRDRFVRCCDGSVLIDSTWRSTAEKDTLPDKSLRGFEVIDRAKRRLEAVCRGKVSCADILAFAARDSVVHVRTYYALPSPRKRAAQLKRRCPLRSNSVVPMDSPSPFTFDTSYYRNLLVNRGLFTSDQTLTSTWATAAKVRQLAGNPMLFQRKFAAAMVKMGKIGVLTGRKGEIRRYCRRTN
nr:PREDICTED: peroxidase 5-like [Musa acuminata subsp. malaccensis]